MILDVIAFTSLIVLLFIVSGFAILYRRKFVKLISVIAQLIVDKQAIANKLDEQVLLNSKEVNDGFIKFLSESRDAAFEYIENVQKAIINYIKAIESNDNDMILTARMELFSYIPENIGNENQDGEDPKK